MTGIALGVLVLAIAVAVGATALLRRRVESPLGRAFVAVGVGVATFAIIVGGLLAIAMNLSM